MKLFGRKKKKEDNKKSFDYFEDSIEPEQFKQALQLMYHCENDGIVIDLTNTGMCPKCGKKMKPVIKK